MNDKLCHIKRIDNLGRIVIPKEICRVADIKSDDLIKIVWNSEEKIISLCKDNNSSFINFVIENVIDILYKTIKCEVIITDNNKVINVYSSSNKLKAVKNKTISMELEKLISSRAIQCKEFDNISISNGIELKEHCYYFSINENSFNVGSILVITNNKISEDLKNFILNQLTK